MENLNKPLLGVLRCSTECNDVFNVFFKNTFFKDVNEIKGHPSKLLVDKEYMLLYENKDGFNFICTDNCNTNTHIDSDEYSQNSTKNKSQNEDLTSKCLKTYSDNGFDKLVTHLSRYLKHFGLIQTEIVKKNSKLFYKFLTDDEIDIYNRYSRLKGKMEFLGGRVLIKLCIIALMYSECGMTLSPNDINIIKEDDGRPKLYIKNNLITTINLSISHKIDYIFCAVIKNSKLGVDVEKVSDRLFKVKRHFLSSDEEEILQSKINNGKSDVDILRLLTMVWASKESAVKYSTSNFFAVAENLKLIDIINNDFIFKLNDKTKIVSHNYLYGNYAFSIIKE